MNNAGRDDGALQFHHRGESGGRIMQRASVTLVNKLGLHARAAASFVKLASTCESEISVTFNGKKVSGKSIMGMMMLAAAKGSTIEISAAGPDESEAISRLGALVEDRFGENE